MWWCRCCGEDEGFGWGDEDVKRKLNVLRRICGGESKGRRDMND